MADYLFHLLGLIGPGAAVEEFGVLCSTAVTCSGRVESCFKFSMAIFQTKNAFQVVPFHIDLGYFVDGGFIVKIMPEMLFVILFVSFTHGSAGYYFICWSEPGM